MKWEKKGERIYGAEKALTYVSRYTRCSKQAAIAFRIDGRDGTYRVDLATGLMPIWQAVDGCKGFATLAEAKAYVQAYAASIIAEGEISTSLIGKRAYGEAA